MPTSARGRCPPTSCRTPSARSWRSFALGTENPGTALSNAMQIKEYGLLADYWDTYPEKTAAVTAADVQRVAQKYIPLDDIVIIAVGDAARIRPMLTSFGTIEPWEAEGRRVAN